MYAAVFMSTDLPVLLTLVQPDCDGGSGFQKERGLAAVLPGGRRVSVIVKLGKREILGRIPKEINDGIITKAKQKEEKRELHTKKASEEALPSTGNTSSALPTPKDESDDGPWSCHSCGRENLSTKKRCGSCQSWRGGTRKNIGGARRAKATPTKETALPKVRATLSKEEKDEEGIVAATETANVSEDAKVAEEATIPQKTKAIEKAKKSLKVKKVASTKDSGQDQGKAVGKDVPDSEEPSMGARLPKRTRKTRVYSSLSPAVIQATAKARAEAFAAAPPSPQLGSKRKQIVDGKDSGSVAGPGTRRRNSIPHPAAIAAETAIASEPSGTVPDEYIGNDGNLFYCRICLGVGEVVCCDGCPHVYHPSCLPVGRSKRSLEGNDDPWYCHECMAAGRDGKPARSTLGATSPARKRRKVKERCSECGRKETKAHPVVQCSARGCEHYFHLVCPSHDEDECEDSSATKAKASSQRLLCSSCRATLAESDGKGGGHVEYDHRKLEDIHSARGRLVPGSGRGGGRGGKGRGGRGGAGRGMRRMSSTEERMKRQQAYERELIMKQQQSGSSTVQDAMKVPSSGFQSPYVEDDDDDEEHIGPESLATVEQPLSSTPAFFFFLLHNRSVIERSLSRRSPFFRSMARGVARNERVAQEGATMWTEMETKERKEWVDISMKDFEQRVVAWREKEVIEAMIRSTEDDDNDAQVVDGEEGDESDDPPLTHEDEAHVAAHRMRMLQLGKVKSRAVKLSGSDNEGSLTGANPILLELLNDARFRPLPLVSASRTREDLAQSMENPKIRVAVQQFAVRGPIETSLGDDCMGCARGWSHYCPVLNRPVPVSEHRSKLQPPVGSLTATRIGLGLKPNLPLEPVHSKGPALPHPSFPNSHGVRRQGAGMSHPEKWDANAMAIAMTCPNYQPRVGFSLSTPSLRLDDTTIFIESAVALKNIDIDANTYAAMSEGRPGTETTTTPGKGRTLSRGLLPLRGRKRSASSESSDLDEHVSGANVVLEDVGKAQRYKCGTCGTIQSSPLGCMPCRKSHLVSQMARREYVSPNDVSDEQLKTNATTDSPTYGDGFAKPLCVMLRRTNLNDVSVSGRKKQLDGGADKVGLSLTKDTWKPSAILAPIPKRLPMPKPPGLSQDAAMKNGVNLSDDDSTVSKDSDLGNRPNSHFDPSLWECTKCSHLNDPSKARCGSCQSWRGGRRANAGKGTRSRSCTQLRGTGETQAASRADRHALALKHKEDADDLARRCLATACYGILAGIVRRDPMRLFADPVPADVCEYHQMINDPVDISTIREKVLSSEYTSLKQFMTDARRMCINACVFNAADSLYAKTAKNIYDSLEFMYDRAKKWITMLKNAHASSFIANEDGRNDSGVDVFKDARLMWPGAVELLEDSEWLKRQATSDFSRTKENEIAYYGTLAIRRAAAAARASLASAPEVGGAYLPVSKRSHVQDELLRRRVDDEVSLHVGPVQLGDDPDLREHQLLKLLKRVQKRRIEGRMSSESGCARCDGVKMGDDTNNAVSLLRSKFKRTIDATRPRVAPSRLSQSTGLASHNARQITAEKPAVDTPPEEIGRVATEIMVSVRGSRMHGWGLFADHPFQKGEVVAEYIGEYVSDAVADLREMQYREQRMQDYQFRVDGSLVIDATLRGGFARYINHSCSPNCVAKVVDGKSPNEHLKRVLIISQRDIQASEELSYDYQFPLEMNLGLRIPCNCGSKMCRGFMNWDTPEKSNRRTAKIISASGSGGNIGRSR